MRVTVDQVVALNVRRWRRAAGLTQDELGQRLGWSGANVSAAERSADSAREPRRFNAQTLADLCLGLSVPLIALFLPPEDDGVTVQYAFSSPGGDHDMGDLMGLVVMPDSDDDAPVMEAYRQEFRAAVGRYLDGGWQEEVARWLTPIEPAGLRAERADRLRAAAAAMLARAEAEARELESLADAIDPPEEEP